MRILEDRFKFALASHLLDVQGYANSVGETFLTPGAAFEHYLNMGEKASPQLFPFIDPIFYLEQSGEERFHNVTPFEHYVTRGASLGFNPLPFFDVKYIQAQMQSDDQLDVFDYVANPKYRDIDPHPLFSKRYYSAVNDDVNSAGLDPFFHFVHHGWRERRLFHPFFREPQYAAMRMDAGGDFASFNREFGTVLKDISTNQLLFDANYFLSNVSHVNKVDCPLLHYLKFDWKLGVSPFPLFEPKFFISQSPPTRPFVNPFVEYLCDFTDTYSPHPLFDPKYYSSEISVPTHFKGSYLEHFIRFGAEQGVSPHRQVVVGKLRPSRHSGLEAGIYFFDRSGEKRLLSVLKSEEELLSAINEFRTIELLAPDNIDSIYDIHPTVRMFSEWELAAIDIARRVALCNYLILSATALDEDIAVRLASPVVGIANSARPWQTFLSNNGANLCYRHIFNGPTAQFEFVLPEAASARILILTKALVAAMPNNLVVKTDKFGLALLRLYFEQLSAAVGRISLIVDIKDLERRDQQWLAEFIAISFAMIPMLICEGEAALTFVSEAGVNTASDQPLIIEL